MSQLNTYDFSSFSSDAKHYRTIPIVKRFLVDTLTPIQIFQNLKNEASFLLESKDHESDWSRYSFIGLKPFLFMDEHKGHYYVKNENQQSLVKKQSMKDAFNWIKDYLVLKPLDIDFLVSSQKAQIVHLGLENTDTENWPVVMPPNDQYILAFDGGKVVVGATHENNKGIDYRITVGGLHEIFDKALSIAPGLSEGTVLETRVGFRPFTPDFLPVIGGIHGHENLYVANGLGASGLTVGPFLGGELAKLAMGIPLEIDLSLYDVNGAIVSQ
ncbi:FAD-dependent oxidoreductase [Bacillus sp. JJ1521]|uniref:NAD(P)/FAD-dependent oxidoreductase n=1 Tax=Bacillus sp. JJ1521 TaxID=3122957 RepID=UPI002FFF530C